MFEVIMHGHNNLDKGFFKSCLLIFLVSQRRFLNEINFNLKYVFEKERHNSLRRDFFAILNQDWSMSFQCQGLPASENTRGIFARFRLDERAMCGLFPAWCLKSDHNGMKVFIMVFILFKGNIFLVGAQSVVQVR